MALTHLCFSLPLGFGISDASRVFLELMRRLGYTQFYLHGSHYGALISTTMAQLYPEYVYREHISRKQCTGFGLPLFCWGYTSPVHGKLRSRTNSLAQTNDFHAICSDYRWLMYLLWNFLQINMSGPYWWSVNIGLGNVVVSWGNRPLFVDQVPWCNMASLGRNWLIHILQGYFTDTWDTRWLSHCQWSDPKIWVKHIYLTTTKHKNINCEYGVFINTETAQFSQITYTLHRAVPLRKGYRLSTWISLNLSMDK